LLSKNFNLFSFHIFWLWVIPHILTLSYSTYFDLECTFWKLFQKRILFTKFYICVFINFFSIQFQLYRGSVTLVGGGNGVPWWSTESKWQTSIHKVVSSTLQYDCDHDNSRLAKFFAWMINIVLQKFQLLNTVYHFHLLPWNESYHWVFFYLDCMVHVLHSKCCKVKVMVFNNISVILWRSVFLVEEARVPGENHRPFASHWQALSHNATFDKNDIGK
jgi:hypothetical protein